MIIIVSQIFFFKTQKYPVYWAVWSIFNINPGPCLGHPQKCDRVKHTITNQQNYKHGWYNSKAT